METETELEKDLWRENKEQEKILIDFGEDENGI
jgi:hypothetical protein